MGMIIDHLQLKKKGIEYELDLGILYSIQKIEYLNQLSLYRGDLPNA